MSRLKTWFQKAVTTFLDPDRESRVTTLVNAIHNGMHVQGQNFALRPTISGLQVTEPDLKEAAARIYRSALERGWADGSLTAGEQNMAKWIAQRLELSAAEARELDFEQARKWFGETLAKAMEDGILDQQEQQRLGEIAASVGCGLPEFMRSFFQREGEAFLRSIFLACVADNRITQQEWNYLAQLTQILGFQWHEMLAAVQPQARQFVEHVLADAKSDGSVTAQESQTLRWLLENLRLPPEFCRYVLGEVQHIETLAAIDEGRLPSIAMPPGMEYRSGEIVHWAGPATWRELRVRKNGTETLDHPGTLVLTDNRLVFSGQIKAQTVNFRKIVSHRGTNAWIELQAEAKPLCQYFLASPSPMTYAIFRSAVAMANQTKVAKVEGATRHIPRDVRQRVWQKYGGRCAECTATDYLEFDHIIPHARGGSNADGNVQLLCRKCNLKKSDSI